MTEGTFEEQQCADTSQWCRDIRLSEASSVPIGAHELERRVEQLTSDFLGHVKAGVKSRQLAEQIEEMHQLFVQRIKLGNDLTEEFKQKGMVGELIDAYELGWWLREQVHGKLSVEVQNHRQELIEVLNIASNYILGQIPRQFIPVIIKSFSKCSDSQVELRYGQHLTAVRSFLRRAEILSCSEHCGARNEDVKASLRSITRNNLGCLFRLEGQMQPAMRCLEEAHEDARKLKGEQCGIAVTSLNLCSVFSDLGNHKKALELAEFAVTAINVFCQDLEKEGAQNTQSTSTKVQGSAALLVLALISAAYEADKVDMPERVMANIFNAQKSSMEAWGSESPVPLELNKVAVRVSRRTNFRQRTQHKYTGNNQHGGNLCPLQHGNIIEHTLKKIIANSKLKEALTETTSTVFPSLAIDQLLEFDRPIEVSHEDSSRAMSTNSSLLAQDHAESHNSPRSNSSYSSSTSSQTIPLLGRQECQILWSIQRLLEDALQAAAPFHATPSRMLLVAGNMEAESETSRTWQSSSFHLKKFKAKEAVQRSACHDTSRKLQHTSHAIQRHKIGSVAARIASRPAQKAPAHKNDSHSCPSSTPRSSEIECSLLTSARTHASDCPSFSNSFEAQHPLAEKFGFDGLPNPAVAAELSIAASDDAQSAIVVLERSISNSSRLLGSSHPLVEQTRIHLRGLKAAEQRSRWDFLVHNHTNSIQQAVLQQDPEALENALDAAASSSMGPGHPAVLDGRRALEALRKEMARRRVSSASELHAGALAALSDNLLGLHSAIPTAAKAIGPAHPAVESARLDYLRLRGDLQRQTASNQWKQFEEEVADAVFIGDEKAIRGAMSRAQLAGIGKGHELMLWARKEAEDLSKLVARAEFDGSQAAEIDAVRIAMLCPSISSAIETAANGIVGRGRDIANALMDAAKDREIENLAAVVRTAQDVLSPSHGTIVEARNRYRELRSRLRNALWSCLEDYHDNAVNCAMDDEIQLAIAIKAAAASPLGPAHLCVEKGKKRLRELRSDRLRAEREKLTTDVEQELLAKLHLAESAVHLAQETMAFSSWLSTGAAAAGAELAHTALSATQEAEPRHE